MTYVSHKGDRWGASALTPATGITAGHEPKKGQGGREKGKTPKGAGASIILTLPSIFMVQSNTRHSR
jgi:hypothetical protein